MQIRKDGVFMIKRCDVCSPKESLQTMIERDPLFYTYIMCLKATSVYDSYFVDANSGTVQSIVSDCMGAAIRPGCLPIVLESNKAELRKEIAEIIGEVQRIGATELSTNATAILKCYPKIMPMVTSDIGVAAINLYVDDHEPVRKLLEKLQEDKVKLLRTIFSVNSEEDFSNALLLAREIRHSVFSFSICTTKLFVSDLIEFCENILGPVHVITKDRFNKTYFVNIFVSGMVINLVAGQTIHNIDLADNDCAPYMRAKNGEITNLVIAGIINNGFEQGWVNGRHIYENHPSNRP